MADLTITAASVLPSTTNAKVDKTANAAASVTAGQAVYLNASGAWDKADNNASGTRQPTGIALHAAAVGQPLAVQTDGDITIGATLTAGTAYYLSGTAGGICPVADLSSGMDVVLIGIAKTASLLKLAFLTPAVTL